MYRNIKTLFNFEAACQLTIDQVTTKRAAKLVPLVLALVAAPFGSVHAENPPWGYAVDAPGAAPAVDDGRTKHVPNSALTFTQSEIAAITVRPPDWHPDEHPPMPGIVGRSRQPQVYACAYCHLPNGAGRPENASLAGLSAKYFKAQIAAFRAGDRPGSEHARAPQTLMVGIAKALTDAEIEESAAYFAALAPVSYTRVVEAAIVPRTVEAGWILKKVAGGGTERIGTRIIEIAPDFERFEKRDSRTPYIAYVPPGSIARGAMLVTAGDGRRVPCATCHGPDLRGLADVPPIVGLSPVYVFRQLYDLRDGARKGATTELMRPVVASLTDADMVAIAAYLASRRP